MIKLSSGGYFLAEVLAFRRRKVRAYFSFSDRSSEMKQGHRPDILFRSVDDERKEAEFM